MSHGAPGISGVTCAARKQIGDAYEKQLQVAGFHSPDDTIGGCSGRFGILDVVPRIRGWA